MTVLKVNLNSDKVYIYAPAKRHTGGPELLHQLGAELRANGVQAFMCYYPNIHPIPVHDNYKKYGVPFVRYIPDSESSIVIVPEVQIPRALKFKKARIGLWWLSVDNYSVAQKKYMAEKPLLRFLKFGTFSPNVDWKEAFSRRFQHLVQSFYAGTFLQEHGIDSAAYLSDYLSPVFLSDKPDIRKEDIVCYNPKKGEAFTRKLIKAAPHLHFVPLINMSSQQVKETLARAKVYIDFGEHPGKDRIPREAAFLGTCVIVGKQGSAANNKDVFIPEKFKYFPVESEVPSVINQIQNCLSNFEETQEEFRPYIEKIQSEQREFKKNVKETFGLL